MSDGNRVLDIVLQLPQGGAYQFTASLESLMNGKGLKFNDIELDSEIAIIELRPLGGLKGIEDAIPEELCNDQSDIISDRTAIEMQLWTTVYAKVISPVDPEYATKMADEALMAFRGKFGG